MATTSKDLANKICLGRMRSFHMLILWRIQYTRFGLLNYMFIFLQGKQEHLSPCPYTQFPLWIRALPDAKVNPQKTGNLQARPVLVYNTGLTRVARTQILEQSPAAFQSLHYQKAWVRHRAENPQTLMGDTSVSITASNVFLSQTSLKWNSNPKL